MTGVWVALGTLGTLGLLALELWRERRAGRSERRVERAVALVEERERRETASALAVRPLPGFSGSEHQVIVYARVTNSGGAHAHEVVVEAEMDGAGVAAAPALELAPGQSERVELAIPRQFVVALTGSEPTYTGSFGLAARDASGQTAHWPQQ